MLRGQRPSFPFKNFGSFTIVNPYLKACLLFLFPRWCTIKCRPFFRHLDLAFQLCSSKSQSFQAFWFHLSSVYPVEWYLLTTFLKCSFFIFLFYFLFFLLFNLHCLSTVVFCFPCEYKIFPHLNNSNIWYNNWSVYFSMFILICCVLISSFHTSSSSSLSSFKYFSISCSICLAGSIFKVITKCIYNKNIIILSIDLQSFLGDR